MYTHGASSLSEDSASALDESVRFFCTSWGWLVQHTQLFCDVDQIIPKSFLIVASNSNYVSVVYTLDPADKSHKPAGKG
jgi:hypothetical protein